MKPLERFSEPYGATGGLAAVGVLNQLGRPHIEPLEVLVREAVQNCWDACRPDSQGIQVEIGRRTLTLEDVDVIRKKILVDPPPGLPLAEELRPGLQTLYFADFGTSGLGGPTRADTTGRDRNFVDFVLNIGQPPDNELGGGSFGYGKAAFYVASRARTVVIDTLCCLPDGQHERRLIGCALGDNFDEDGRPYTGRHWWGRIVDGVAEPLTGAEAEAAAHFLGLPNREGKAGLGTTVMVVAPGLGPESEGQDTDATMEFVAESLAWNFWPRMLSTPNGHKTSMTFKVFDNGVRLRIPNPRTHERLRDFVAAMDQHREEPTGDADFSLDRSVECLRPIRTLGRLVIRQGPVAPVALPNRAVPQGARVTSESVHHVALMRQAELVVKYLPGPAAVAGRMGYAGVFKCDIGVDAAFRRSEPPTHDDWNHTFVPTDAGYDKTFVKVALDRIAGVCREAAGYTAAVHGSEEGDAVPLGEFADALASLMPGLDGPGARRRKTPTREPAKAPRSAAPGRSAMDQVTGTVWVEGLDAGSTESDRRSDGAAGNGAAGTQTTPLPQSRSAGDAVPGFASDGTAVMRYPFDLRVHGAPVRLRAKVEVMTNDGARVEVDPPLGYTEPVPHAWIRPDGVELAQAAPVAEAADAEGSWVVEIPLIDEAMIRVDITPELA